MNGLQHLFYDTSRVLLWPALIAVALCLIWTAIEAGVFLYELWLRFRFRSLDALEGRALRARRAFAEGKPRTAYRALQENRYSLIVMRFLFSLIHNYQTERLEAKPLKLLQESEFATLKRLERTRILVRLGPILGLMGTLILLSPALLGLSQGNAEQFITSLTTAFSLTILGLLIGVVAFTISIVRDRIYAQDLSDLEYLVELLEGTSGRLTAGRRRTKKGIWEADPPAQELTEEPEAQGSKATQPQAQVPPQPPQPEAQPQAQEREAAPPQTEEPEAQPEAQPAQPEATPRPAPEAAQQPTPEVAPQPTAAQPDVQPEMRPAEPEAPPIPEASAFTQPASPPPPTATPRPAPDESFGDIDEPDAFAPDCPTTLPATPLLSWPEASQPGDTRGFLSIDEPTLIWPADEDPFAELGPVDDPSQPS